MTDPGAEASTRRSLFHNSAFVRLWLAGAISLAGSFVGQVALVYYVFVTTGSSLDVAYVGIAGLVPNLALAFVSGTIADRYPRRRIMVLSDIVRAVSWAAIALILWTLGLSLPLVLIGVGIAAAFLALFYPAERALLPHLIREEEIPTANGILLSTNQIVGFVATSVGGILVAAVGVIPAVLFNSSTFVASAVLLASIALPLHGSLHAPEAPPGRAEPFWPSVRAGFTYLRSNVGLLQLTVSAAFLNFFLSIVLTFLVVYVVGELGYGSVVYGFVVGSFSIGFAVGAVLVGRTAAVRHMGKVWALTGAASAGPIALLVLFPGPGVAFGAVFALGALAGFGGVTWLSGAQLIVPREMQGRYFGVDQLGSIAILPLAQILGGVLIAQYGILDTYAFTAAGAAASGLGFGLLRPLWRLGYPPGSSGAAALPPPRSPG